MDYFFFILAKRGLVNYSGGTNPVLIYIFFGIILFVITLTAFYAIHKAMRRSKFYGKLGAVGVTGEELGILMSFIKRFNIVEPLEIVSHRPNFNQFMDRVAHHYEHSRLSEEAMIREVQIFDRIRRKLGFIDTLADFRCTNSRALPLDHPLTIRVTDPDTHETFTFRSRVLANYDFFLGIEPPEKVVDKETFNKKRPACHIEFDLEGGPHHSFESRYLRNVNYPENMWCLQQSSNITTAELHDPLNIPSNLMLTDDTGAEVSEVHGKLVELSNKECRFQLKSDSDTLEIGAGVLVNFDIEDDHFMARASIEDCQQVEKTKIYRLSFAGLEEEEQRLIVRFAHQEKKKKNKSGSA